MPGQRHGGVVTEGLVVPTKIRKRGCSSSSSSSSRVRNYRLSKRAILVGKNRAGPGARLGGSRSVTPAPTWRIFPMKCAVDSPRCSLSGKSTQPVSARKLAATLWEMNEVPCPKVSDSNMELMKQRQKESGSKAVFKREKIQSGCGLHSDSGSLPPHVSDPSHSPTVSERMDQSLTGNRLRMPSISQRLSTAEQNAALFDSIRNANFLEIETRADARTIGTSVSGCGNRLRDVNNALTTSKELLKIINRIWADADQPSSSMAVISALRSELERARLQVNQLMLEQLSGKNEINYLMKCFAEEKALWKIKEHQAIEEAIRSIASELEVERKLRQRLESLNKKLGKELAEVKSSFMKAVKDLESEKRAREITEQACNELARNVDDGRVEVDERESVKVHEEAEQERGILELADKSHEERVQMKLSEAKHPFEDKNSAIGKLRKQLEGFLGTVRGKDEKRATHLSNSENSSREKEQEDTQVEDGIESKAGSAESDLHLIELNMNNINKIYKSARASAVGPESSKLWADEIKARISVSGQVSQSSTSLQRSVSDAVACIIEPPSHQNLGDGVDMERLHEIEPQRTSCLEEAYRYRYKYVKGLKAHMLSSSRLSSVSSCCSPSNQRGQSLPLSDPRGAIPGKHGGIQATGSKPRTGDTRGEGQSTRRSKW